MLTVCLLCSIGSKGFQGTVWGLLPCPQEAQKEEITEEAISYVSAGKNSKGPEPVAGEACSMMASVHFPFQSLVCTIPTNSC